MDDAIWDNTNPCNVSLDDMSGTEVLVNIDGTKNQLPLQQHSRQAYMTRYGTTPIKNVICGTMS